MILLSVVLAAAVSAHASQRPAEERLRALLEEQKQERTQAAEQVRVAVGQDDSMRDALASQPEAAGKRRVMDHLPGMSRDPFGLCRALVRCTEAPLSFHVEDEALVSDAVVALVRPWIQLQRARGKDLEFAPSGAAADRAVAITLAGLPDAGLSVRVTPVPTGGFDVALRGAADPEQLFLRERAAVLPASVR
jgi:hypothetical protein